MTKVEFYGRNEELERWKFAVADSDRRFSSFKLFIRGFLKQLADGDNVYKFIERNFEKFLINKLSNDGLVRHQKILRFFPKTQLSSNFVD